MSNYHVLDASDKEDKVKVVFHVVVPDELNGVGVNLRTCLVQYKEYIQLDKVTEVVWLQIGFPIEYGQIESGEVFEYSEFVEVNADLSVLDKRTVLDNRFNTLNTAIPNLLRKRLRFWGLDRNV